MDTKNFSHIQSPDLGGLGDILMECPIEIMGSDNLNLTAEEKDNIIYIIPEEGHISRVRIKDLSEILSIEKTSKLYSFSYSEKMFVVRFSPQASK